ncbi:vWA domain-containing protein [Legionella brunensis]|uniref:VWFA domain-containing protein n=1 Tax=Legionella brunensis TaxID=29422 RepID=A0A0W0SEG6_9GAMM|nr:vWA domain-containing protein [Legionella brunensis]KTC81485.1 hypothetical protein Lbru_2005 [Legionella brunensis]
MKLKKEDPKTSEILKKNSKLFSVFLEETNGLARFLECVKKARKLKEDISEIALFIDFDQTITQIHDFSEYRFQETTPNKEQNPTAYKEYLLKNIRNPDKLRALFQRIKERQGFVSIVTFHPDKERIKEYFAALYPEAVDVNGNFDLSKTPIDTIICPGDIKGVMVSKTPHMHKTLENRKDANKFKSGNVFQQSLLADDDPNNCEEAEKVGVISINAAEKSYLEEIDILLNLREMYTDEELKKIEVNLEESRKKEITKELVGEVLSQNVDKESKEYFLSDFNSVVVNNTDPVPVTSIKVGENNNASAFVIARTVQDSESLALRSTFEYGIKVEPKATTKEQQQYFLIKDFTKPKEEKNAQVMRENTRKLLEKLNPTSDKTQIFYDEKAFAEKISQEQEKYDQRKHIVIYIDNNSNLQDVEQFIKEQSRLGVVVDVVNFNANGSDSKATLKIANQTQIKNVGGYHAVRDYDLEKTPVLGVLAHSLSTTPAVVTLEIKAEDGFVINLPTNSSTFTTLEHNKHHVLTIPVIENQVQEFPLKAEINVAKFADEKSTMSIRFNGISPIILRGKRTTETLTPVINARKNERVLLQYVQAFFNAVEQIINKNEVPQVNPHSILVGLEENLIKQVLPSNQDIVCENLRLIKNNYCIENFPLMLNYLTVLYTAVKSNRIDLLNYSLSKEDFVQKLDDDLKEFPGHLFKKEGENEVKGKTALPSSTYVKFSEKSLKEHPELREVAVRSALKYDYVEAKGQKLIIELPKNLFLETKKESVEEKKEAEKINQHAVILLDITGSMLKLSKYDKFLVFMKFLKNNFKELSDPNRNYYLTIIGWNFEANIILDRIDLKKCDFEKEIFQPLEKIVLEGSTNPSCATDKLMEFWRNLGKEQSGKNELHVSMITDGTPNDGRWGQELVNYARNELRKFLHQENVSMSGLILDNSESSFLEMIDMFDSSPAHLPASFNVIDLLSSTKPADLEAAAYFSIAKNLLLPYPKKIDFVVHCEQGVRVTTHFSTQTSGSTDNAKILTAQTWVEESAENIRIEIPLSMARKEKTPLCANIKISAGGKEIELRFDDEQKLPKKTETRISENYSCKEEELMATLRSLRSNIHTALWSNQEDPKDRITALENALNALEKMENPPKGFKGVDDKNQTVELGLKLCLKYANQKHRLVKTEIINYLSSLMFVINRGVPCPCFFNLKKLEVNKAISFYLQEDVRTALRLPSTIANGYMAQYEEDNAAVYVSQLSKDMEEVENPSSKASPGRNPNALFGGESVVSKGGSPNSLSSLEPQF